MNTLIHGRFGAAGQADNPAAKPFLNPYFANFMLGMVLLATYAARGPRITDPQRLVLAFGAWGMAKLEKRFAYLNPAR